MILFFDKKPLLSLREAQEIVFKNKFDTSRNTIRYRLQRSGITRSSTVIRPYIQKQKKNPLTKGCTGCRRVSSVVGAMYYLRMIKLLYCSTLSVVFGQEKDKHLFKGVLSSLKMCMFMNASLIMGLRFQVLHRKPERRQNDKIV